MTASARPPVVAPAPAAKVVNVPASVHIVNRGDTLMSISRRNNISLSQLAKANNLPPSAQLKLGSKITVPGRTASAEPALAQPAGPALAATETKPGAGSRRCYSCEARNQGGVSRADPKGDAGKPDSDGCRG